MPRDMRADVGKSISVKNTISPLRTSELIPGQYRASTES
jgi:hypothetical protein